MGSMMQKLKGSNQTDQSMVQQQQQAPVQYRPPAVQMQQQVPQNYPPPGSQMPPGYGQPRPNNFSMSPRYSGPPPMSSSSSYENDMLLSNLYGLSPTDVGQLRLEFYNYTNSYGVIDREGFKKLYVASLVNKTWEMIEREAETAFRNFDANQTGGLDFNEYMMACARMMRGNPQQAMYPY